MRSCLLKRCRGVRSMSDGVLLDRRRTMVPPCHCQRLSMYLIRESRYTDCNSAVTAGLQPMLHTRLPLALATWFYVVRSSPITSSAVSPSSFHSLPPRRLVVLLHCVVVVVVLVVEVFGNKSRLLNLFVGPLNLSTAHSARS